MFRSRSASRLVPASAALLALPCLIPAQGQLSSAPASPPRQVERIFTPRLQQPVVFFTNNVVAGSAKLGRMGLRGNGLRNLIPMSASGTPSYLGITVDEKNCLIYYGIQDGFESSIERMNVDGTGRTQIVTNPWPSFVAGSVSLDRAGGGLFFTSTNSSTRIGWCALDGSNVKHLVSHNAVSPIVSPRSLAFDVAAGRLYWWDDAKDGFRMANADGSNVQPLHDTGQVTSHVIDVVNGDLYWTKSDELWRVPIDGSAPEARIATDPRLFDTLNLAVHPSMDFIVWSSDSKRISWTPRSSPGPVSSTSVPHDMRGMSLARGPFFCPVSASAGGPRAGHGRLALEVLAGAPGLPFRVELVELNGEPATAHLGQGVLDAEGTARIDAPVPVDLRGATARIALDLFDPAAGQRIRREIETSLR